MQYGLYTYFRYKNLIKKKYDKQCLKKNFDTLTLDTFLLIPWYGSFSSVKFFYTHLISTLARNTIGV